MSLQKKLVEVVDWIEAHWVGQSREAIEVLVVSVILRENPLLFSTPGTGKTDVARAVARLLGMKFKKIGCSEARKSLSGALYRLTIKQDDGNITYYASFDSLKPEEDALILIDEVNRAPAQLQNELLGLLEEGILTTTFGDVYKVNWRFILAMNPYAGSVDRALLDRTVAIPVRIPQFSLTYVMLEQRLNGKLVYRFSDLAQQMLSPEDLRKIEREIANIKVSRGIQFLATMFNYALTCKHMLGKDPNLFAGVFSCEYNCPFAQERLYTEFNGERIEIAQLCHQVRWCPAPRAVIKALKIAKGLAWLRGRSEVEVVDFVDAAKCVYMKYLENSRLVYALIHKGRLQLYAYVIKLIKKLLAGDKSVIGELLKLAQIDIGIHNTVSSLVREVLGEQLEKLLEKELGY